MISERGRAEKRRQRTVSGSDVAGFSVPCEGEDCPHIELDDARKFRTQY
ncbi:MAG: hypothetical protein WBA41_00835 [Rivularia sp. (in: cyanobacteria)]